MPAWTRVHRSDEHEFARECERSGRARHRNASILERLTHHLQSRSVELRKFIQEEDPIVGKTHFPRSRLRGPSKQASVRNRVMRATERPGSDKMMAIVQKIADAVYFGRFNRFSKCERRQDGRNPLCDH